MQHLLQKAERNANFMITTAISYCTNTFDIIAHPLIVGYDVIVSKVTTTSAF
jgi:hypothetical protein